MKQEISISDHFTFKRLVKFVLPSIGMMLFTSIYGVVDGLFVSNFAGKIAFSAVNFVMPVPMAFACVGTMLGTGGSALVAKTLGEGKTKQANEIFTLLFAFLIVVGLIITAIAVPLLKPIVRLMGASDAIFDDCIVYGTIILCGNVFYLLQTFFQCLFITAGKPRLGLLSTVAAGVTNIVMDAVLVAGFSLGVRGAAIATCLSMAVGGTIPVVYFAMPNHSYLRFCKFPVRMRFVGRACFNGVSEMMSMLSMSVVNIAYNYQLMRMVGETGVAAHGSVMYVGFIYFSIFLGFSNGLNPLVGYHFGADNKAELKNLLKLSLLFVLLSGGIVTFIAEGLAHPLAFMFGGYDQELFDMTCLAFRLYSLSFLVMGFNVLGSGFFTALNNGVVSGVISFTRTLVFELAAVIVMPILFGVNGIWLSVVVAEVGCLVLTAIFFLANRKKYGYL